MYQQNDRKTQLHQSYKQNLREANITSNEAMEHGRRALDSLAVQEEILRDTEDIVESNEYTLEKTMKILRGMTWSGMIYNAFNSEPSLSDVKGKQSSAVGSSQGNTKTNSHGSYDRTSNVDQHNENKDALLNNSSSRSTDDPEVSQLSKNVGELLSMSQVLGEQISSQKDTINRIDEKTNRVHDKTLAATLKTSQLSKSGSSKPKFLGVYQFVEAGSAKYLSVLHEDIVLVKESDRSTYFNVYLKSGNLMGIQNIKTLRYIGVTMWGTVVCSGFKFGRYEECYVELDGRPSGLVVLSTNWGGGGYLKQTRQLAKQIKLEEQGIATNIEMKDPSENRIFSMSDVTGSMLDKNGMLTIHALRTQEGDADWCEEKMKAPSD